MSSVLYSTTQGASSSNPSTMHPINSLSNNLSTSKCVSVNPSTVVQENTTGNCIFGQESKSLFHMNICRTELFVERNVVGRNVVQYLASVFKSFDPEFSQYLRKSANCLCSKNLNFFQLPSFCYAEPNELQDGVYGLFSRQFYGRLFMPCLHSSQTKN